MSHLLKETVQKKQELSYSKVTSSSVVGLEYFKNVADKTMLSKTLAQLTKLSTEYRVNVVDTLSAQETALIKPFYFNPLENIYSLIAQEGNESEFDYCMALNRLLILPIGGKIETIDRLKKNNKGHNIIDLRKGAVEKISQLYSEISQIFNLRTDLIARDYHISQVSTRTKIFLRNLANIVETTRQSQKQRRENFYYTYDEEDDRWSAITKGAFVLLPEDEKEEYYSFEEVVVQLRQMESSLSDFERVHTIRIDAFPKSVHQNLMTSLGYNEINLCYQMTIQMLKLLTLNIVLNPSGELGIILRRLTSAGGEISVRKTITDLREVPHLYTWPIVCSPKEISMIFQKTDPNEESVMTLFNKATKLFKQRKDEAHELFARVTQAVNNLKPGVKAIIFTRLKAYHHIRKSSPELFKKSKNGSLIHWKYDEFIHHMYSNDQLTLVMEESLLACAAGYYSSVAECRQLADQAYIRPDKRGYLFFKEVLNVPLVERIETRIESDEANSLEVILLTSVKDRIERSGHRT